AVSESCASMFHMSKPRRRTRPASVAQQSLVRDGEEALPELGVLGGQWPAGPAKERFAWAIDIRKHSQDNPNRAFHARKVWVSRQLGFSEVCRRIVRCLSVRLMAASASPEARPSAWGRSSPISDVLGFLEASGALRIGRRDYPTA